MRRLGGLKTSAGRCSRATELEWWDGLTDKGSFCRTMFVTSRARREPFQSLVCTFLAKCSHTSPTPSDMTTWTTSSSGTISKAMYEAFPLGVFECVLWACEYRCTLEELSCALLVSRQVVSLGRRSCGAWCCWLVWL